MLNWMFHGRFRWPWGGPRIYAVRYYPFGPVRILASSREQARTYFMKQYHG